MLESVLNLPVTASAMWILICGLIFGTLQSLFPIDPDVRGLRKDVHIDLACWIVTPMVLGSAASGLITFGFFVLFNGDLNAAQDWMMNGAGWVQGWPLWAQALGVLIVTDISMYWTHRLFHHASLWRFHAIHHAPETLDWLHAARFHPVNLLFHGILANAVAMWIGFPPAAVAALTPFNVLYSAMVHANLNWTFGPLRHVFASPVFHRWHHTGADEGGSKNFAPTFSCLDHLFGTFYMPDGQIPRNLGLTERDMPGTISGQLLYPLIGGTPQATAAAQTQARQAQPTPGSSMPFL